MLRFIWIIAFIILEQLPLPMMVAFTIKRDCVFAPVNELLSRRQFLNILQTDQLFNVGPKKSPTYDPQPGYEPYWPGGEWVFEKFDITTEKPEGSMCGKVCPDLYKHFGEICGRNIKYKHKTFPDYCALLNEDCFGKEKWLIAYRGKCQDELKTYPQTVNLLVTRAEEYLNIFFKSNPTRLPRIYSIKKM
ncbi:uncharacterized protein LOC126776124 isoform X2 [Nymphalis io]|uniref:uncharacterized protein LOC126776124 isoform X2 n=1 Tax=Inachis io TaxID=171585 RepID=UPI002168D3F4|nr:uncharacterized protein LOC126776124 isoform X2 [Nymphalis io]